MAEILIISPSDLEKDPRVRRHIEVAEEFGRVTTCGYGQKSLNQIRHLEVPPAVRFISRSVITLLMMQFGLHQTAARRSGFYKEAKQAIEALETSFDCVLVNDFHALQVARDLFHPSKIWVDMHEYAPGEGDHDWRWRIALKRHIKNLCLRHLNDVRVVSSVGNAICKQYEQDLRRDVTLLINASPFFDKSKTRKRTFVSDYQVHLVHVGVAIRARHLENMILAAQAHPDVFLHLYILPTERQYFEEIFNLCKSITNVCIEEALQVDEIIPQISQFDAGVIAIPPTNFNYENGLPNKLFQYIQARLPIITGPLAEIAEIVACEGIGIVISDFSVAAIASGYEEFKAVDKETFEEPLDRAAEKYSVERQNMIRREIFASMLSSLKSNQETIE